MTDLEEVKSFAKQSILLEYSDIPGCTFIGIDHIGFYEINQDAGEYECAVYARWILLTDYPKDIHPDSIKPEEVELSIFVYVDDDGELAYQDVERIN